MAKILWGIISTANIGTEKVIPAMQKGQYCEITAIASRDPETAKSAANRLNIPKAYGSYDKLLADKDIEAIYIPLPNHLHAEWVLKSLKAGKHVLCEKPITMNYKDAVDLYNEVQKFPNLKIMEAFMYRHHPQIRHAKKLVENGTIGNIRNMYSVFSYYNDDPGNIRNMADIGGGALLDIGCYCISISRFMFGEEPVRVCGSIDFDPVFKTDRLASVVMEFRKGTATFSCSTQMADHRHALIFGTKGKLELPNPFVPQHDEKVVISKTVGNNKVEELIFDPVDQYTLQGDYFSKAILDNTAVPIPFEDAIANMKVIDAIFKSVEKGKFVEI